MFKFLCKAFALLVLSIFFISSAQARDYKEGLDYEIRATNKTVEPEIREFFSFFCAVRIYRVIYSFIVRVFLYMLGIISYYATICVRVLPGVWACRGQAYPQSAFG